MKRSAGLWAREVISCSIKHQLLPGGFADFGKEELVQHVVASAFPPCCDDRDAAGEAGRLTTTRKHGPDFNYAGSSSRTFGGYEPSFFEGSDPIGSGLLKLLE
jgi:hypothetical protein